MKSIYDDEYREIIEKLVARRKELGMTQKELAEKLGLEHTVISKIENCIRRLDIIETKKLCQALKLNITDLL